MGNSASDDNLAQRLEGVVLNPPYQPLSTGHLQGPPGPQHRQCSGAVLPTNIDRIQPGQYCSIGVTGGGSNTTWYYYLRMDGTHALIWRTTSLSLEVPDRFSGIELSARPRYDPEMHQVHFGDQPPVDGSQCEP